MSLVGLLRRLQIPPKRDYVEAFQELVAAGQEHAVRRDGQTRRRMTEAALQVGDYARALEEARRLVLEHIPDAAVHRLRGLAALGALATDLVKVPSGVGTPPPDVGPVQSVVEEARQAFRRALELQPDDAVAKDGLKALEELERESAVCVLPPA